MIAWWKNSGSKALVVLIRQCQKKIDGPAGLFIILVRKNE